MKRPATVEWAERKMATGVRSTRGDGTGILEIGEGKRKSIENPLGV